MDSVFSGQMQNRTAVRFIQRFRVLYPEPVSALERSDGRTPRNLAAITAASAKQGRSRISSHDEKRQWEESNTSRRYSPVFSCLLKRSPRCRACGDA